MQIILEIALSNSPEIIWCHWQCNIALLDFPEKNQMGKCNPRSSNGTSDRCQTSESDIFRQNTSLRADDSGVFSKIRLMFSRPKAFETPGIMDVRTEMLVLAGFGGPDRSF